MTLDEYRAKLSNDPEYLAAARRLRLRFWITDNILRLKIKLKGFVKEK